MDEMEVFIDEAVAVGLKAIEQGVARRNISKKELRSEVVATLKRSYKITKLLMKYKIIPPPPK
jgi:malate dehydrogenase (oxaloacetate-decarboxylating)